MEQTDLEVVLDPIVVRLLEFIRRHGGPSKVAKRLGIKPALFYNYEAGRNKQPSPDILRQIAEKYDDFDPLYILIGRESAFITPQPQAERPAPAVSPSPSSAVQDMEIAGLKKEIKRLEETNSLLRSIVGSQLGKDLDSKIESANISTRYGQLFINSEFAKRRSIRFLPVDVRNATPMPICREQFRGRR